MTTTADAIPTDSPHVTAVPPEAIPPATAEQLLGRVHAKLSDVDASVAAAAHKVVAMGERILARIEELAAKAAGPVGAAASAIAALTPPPVSTVAGYVADLCGCGHDVLHTIGGCTAPNCTCKAPPRK